MPKQRVSVSVDAELVVAGQAAVAAGEADNLSGWVNQAMARQAAHDRAVRAIDEFLAAFEADHGEVTAAEITAATRRARASAIVVRGRRGVA